MWEDVSTDKGTDLADSCCNTVVSSSDTSGASLGCKKTDVVAGSQLTESLEDAKHDGESGDLTRDFVVHAGHDESNDSLKRNAEDKSNKREDNTNAKTSSPDGAEVAVVAGGGNNIYWVLAMFNGTGYDEDNSRHHQRVGTRPVISEETKDELSDHGSDKGNVGNELEGG
ncbi:hypothetical protein HG530_014918 [Fusarium avenaceum]|nr:hypothetical protein HG530_014918 [Fusarium avenaceum]